MKRPHIPIFHVRGTKGTIDEDGEGGWYNPSNTRPLNHFYNPKTGTGLPIPFTKTALEYGPPLWDESKDKYNMGNINEAYIIKPYKTENRVKPGRFWF